MVLSEINDFYSNEKCPFLCSLVKMFPKSSFCSNLRENFFSFSNWNKTTYKHIAESYIILLNNCRIRSSIINCTFMLKLVKKQRMHNILLPKCIENFGERGKEDIYI